jgi:hypothetical protein
MIFVIILISLGQIFYILFSEIWLKKRFSFLLVTSSIFFVTYYLPFFIGLIQKKNVLDLNSTVQVILNSNDQINASWVLVFEFFAYLFGYKLLSQLNPNKLYSKIENTKKTNKLINFLSLMSISACFSLLIHKIQIKQDLYYHMKGLGWLYWIGIYFGMILLPINYIFNNCNRLLNLNYLIILVVLLFVYWRLSASIYFIIILCLAIFSYFKKVNKPKLISTLLVIIFLILISELISIIYNAAESNYTNIFNTQLLNTFTVFLYSDIGRYPFFVATYSQIIELANQHTFNQLLIPFFCYFRQDNLCAFFGNLGDYLFFGSQINAVGGYTVSSAGEKILLFGFYGSFIISIIIGIINRYIDNLLFCYKKSRVNLGIALILAMNFYELSPPKVEPLLISLLLIKVFLIINEKKFNFI